MRCWSLIVGAFTLAAVFRPGVVAQRVGPVSIEAESLVSAAVTAPATKVAVQNMQPFGAGWSGGAQLFWAPTQIGAELQLAFSVGAPGRYEVFLHFTKAPDYALVRASIDGAPWVTFNGYAGTVTRDRALLGMRDITAGRHELLLKIAAKDGPSQGFNVGLDRIALEPVAASAAAVGPENRSRPLGQPGSLPNAAAASAVEGATPPVPVLHVTSGDAPPQKTMTRAIQPMPMATRIALTEKATGAKGQTPEEPLRLSASTPRVMNRAHLSIENGGLSAGNGDGSIWVGTGAALVLKFFQLTPNRPHLLDCGVHVGKPTEVRIKAYVHQESPGKPQGPEIYKMSPPVGQAQHLLAVLIPEKPFLWIGLESRDYPVDVEYCELTPFK